MRRGRGLFGDLKPPRRYRPSVVGLEPRDLPATAVASLVVTPAILSPPNNRFVAVQVSGRVIESNPKARPGAQFHVIDEYARYQPSGKVTLTNETSTVYNFSFKVVLQARRAQQDIGGRQYNVIVGAQDDQNAQGLAVSVLVPHNKVNTTAGVQTSSIAHMRVRHKR